MTAAFILGATVFLSSLAAALLALTLLPKLAFHPPRKSSLADLAAAPIEQAVFLFEEGALIDATRPARTLLASLPGQSSDWKRLSDYLSRHVDRFLPAMSDLPASGEIELRGGGLCVRVECLGEVTRLTLEDTNREGAGILIDGLSMRAQETELNELRECLAQAPILIWRTDAAGTIVWANGGYLFKVMERDHLREDELTWPIPALFAPTAAHEDVKRRLSLAAQPHMAELWYDCHSFASGDGTLYYAIPANTAVRAERSQQEFRQTLAKTFAHVPIGLAIFDRSRQLQLFNPALVDLTSLDVDFLSARPALPSFLDRLREARIIPEPKDYGLWRQQMADVERDAAAGQYEETWALPSGLTYRVTGHPHGDGALVFLFEDISAETAMTRSFRTELQLGQAVMDALDEAVAVFAASGELIMSNAPYAALWHVDPSATLGTMRILDAVRSWQSAALPDPIWGDLRDFVGDVYERAEWSGECTMRDGRRMVCRAVPLPGGATFVGFSASHDAPPPGPQGAAGRIMEDFAA